ncbi:MAG: T9SS type A sorting domain-containing protein [Candidatus Marinimicrobia bacterium]|nr:T9SS type A sorting domain-containing protein [Candidatus Neomarinimicrobiota bacterium]
MKKLQVLFLFSTIGLSQSLWTQSEGVAIRQGVHIEWQRTVCPGANDDMIVFWSETRDGNRDIYAQKIGIDGTMMWSDGGKPITELPGRQEDPVAIEDGSGGAYVAWVDYRLDIAGDIFVQHIDSNGDLLLDNNGVALCQHQSTQITINMCKDGSGGVYVTWQDKRNGVNDDIYGTHISSDHVIVNEGDGHPIVSFTGNQFEKSIEYAGNGEALLVWTDTRNAGNSEIYGQRFGMDMLPLFDVSGINISSDVILDVRPRTTYMHGDTSLVAWKNGAESSTILYNLLTSSGVLYDSHRFVSFNDAIKSNPRLKNDSSGNVFITWNDIRFDTTNGDAFTQKVDMNGDIVWDSVGVLLDNTEYLNKNVRFVSDDLGGAWYFWERGVFPDIDIIALNISSDQMANEYIVTDNPKEQSAPISAKDGNNGAYILFADIKTGSIWLRAQHINTNGDFFESGELLIREGLDGDVKFLNKDNNSNGIVLAWEDTRSGSKSYGNWITTSGDIENFNGKQITFSNSESTVDEAEPKMLLTDNSIYYVTYSTETGANLVKINSLDHNLDNLWDSTGIAIYEGIADQRRANLINTPSGIGCIWSETRNQIDFDVYYQILNSNGNPVLQSDGVLINDATYKDDYVIDIIQTPDGNLIVILFEQATNNHVYIAKKIDFNGNVISEWSNNGKVTIAGPIGEPKNLKSIVIDDTMGILLAWNETNNFAADIKVQILKWDGTTIWSQGGIFATTYANDQVNIEMDITPDRTKALLVWEDFENGTEYNITAQVLDIVNGTLLGENITFTDDTTFQVRPKVHNLTEDQFLIVWEDSRGINNPDPTKAIGSDLYWTWYSISNNSFELNGRPLVQQFHRQEHLQFAELSENELLLYWIDLRSSGKEDFSSLYGKLYLKPEFLISIDPITPEEYFISDAFPNPFNGATVIEFNVKNVVPVDITITNILGQVIYEAVMLPNQPGRYQFTWHGTDILNRPIASGIYFYKISINNVINTGKLTYLK